MGISTVSLWTIAVSTVVVLAANGGAAANGVGEGRTTVNRIILTGAIDTDVFEERNAERIATRILADERRLELLKGLVPEAFIEAALEEFKVGAALGLARRTSSENCYFAGTQNGVLLDRPAHAPLRYVHEMHLPPPRNCLRLRLMHTIASSPAAAVDGVDWRHEIEETFPDIPDSSKRNLLTSLAVTQARNGDRVGALATARSHLLLRDDVEESSAAEFSTRTMIAVAVAEQDPAAALELLKHAQNQCATSKWCSRDEFPFSEVRVDLGFAFARIAAAFADIAAFVEAESVLDMASRLIGAEHGYVEQARHEVVVALARAGLIFEAVHGTAAIADADLKRRTRKEVESIIVKPRQT